MELSQWLGRIATADGHALGTVRAVDLADLRVAGVTVEQDGARVRYAVADAKAVGKNKLLLSGARPDAAGGYDPIGAVLLGASGRALGEIVDAKLVGAQVRGLIVKKRVSVPTDATLTARDGALVLTRPKRGSSAAKPTEPPAHEIVLVDERDEATDDVPAHAVGGAVFAQALGETVAAQRGITLPTRLAGGADEPLSADPPPRLDGVPAHVPARIIADYTFLLGRTATRDVDGVIRAGETVLAQTVLAAHKLGALLELTVKTAARN